MSPLDRESEILQFDVKNVFISFLLQTNCHKAYVVKDKF